MKLVVFGLTVSSAWGNGHATLWRGLIAALVADGHHVTFFERDVPYYAQNRDLLALPGGELVLYRDWAEALPLARRALDGADVGLVTSFCPDGVAATELLAERRVVRACYDLDTPVTLARLASGAPVEWLGPDAMRPFDVVFSYTGGPALAALRDLGAARALALYGWVNPGDFQPAPARADIAGSAMTYLGTYADDRQAALRRLFLDPAAARPDRRFAIGGAQYPASFPWTANTWFVRHVDPAHHPAFYAAGRLTLNVTRAAMAASGWCPSGRLFEAASCGTALLSDRWTGIETFFEPDREILLADTTDEALAALDRSDAELARIASAGRERTLADHTAARRARQMVAALDMAHA